MQKTALITSGVVFALLTISHAIRWLSPVEVLVDGTALPLIISLSSGVILATLSVWMFIAANKKNTPGENKEDE
jgi:hypothetical protein